MRCIPSKDFARKYPLVSVIGAGSYGKVYSSVPGIVVKKQPWNDDAFIREVTMMSQLRHPNICPIKDICFHGENSFLAMQKGKDLFKNYNAGKITIRDIVSDLISAFAFLEVNHIFHGDLKASNTVVLEENGRHRVALIDFGLAEILDTYDENGIEDMSRREAYTYSFRDPSYSEGAHNPIRCELYSIAATVYYLLRNQYFFGVSRPYYISREMFRKVGVMEEDILDFLMECQAPLKTIGEYPARRSAKDLLYHPAIDQSRITPPRNVLSDTYRTRDFVEDMSDINVSLQSLYTAAYSMNSKLSAVCCAADLVLRYYRSPDRKLSAIDVSAGALCIALYLYDENSVPSGYWKDLFGIQKSTEIICELFTALDGKLLYRNQYNCITSKNNALATLSMFRKIEYDSSKRYLFDDPLDVKRKFWMQDFDRNEIVSSDTSATEVREYSRIPMKPFKESFIRLIRGLSTQDSEAAYLSIGLVATREDLKTLSKEMRSEILRHLIMNAKRSESYEMLKRLGSVDEDFSAPRMTAEQFMEKLSRIAGLSAGVKETYRAIEKSPIIGTDLANFEASASSPAEAVIEFLNFLRDFDVNVWKDYVEQAAEYPNTLEWISSWFSRDSDQKFFLMIEISEIMD
jgi:serine/threonine protein kinase